MKTGKTGIVLAAVLLCSVVGTGAFGSVNDDQVTSQKIKEADGTSGQNTNSGSGVKTGHIQDGAVTDAKIGGTISQSKVNGLEVSLAGKADVTHNHDVLYQHKYGKVAVVAQTGGDYTDPVSAMNAIATWCGTPSETNPCLVKIMPGVYTVNSPVYMSAYVDIEGSGEKVTKIGGNLCGTGILLGASNAEVRNITIENTSVELCDGFRNAVVNNNASPSIRNVTAIATQGHFSWAIYNLSSSPQLTNVTAISAGAGPLGQSTGIYNLGSSPTIINVWSSGSGAKIAYGMINTQGSAAEVRGGSFSASGAFAQNNGITNSSSSLTISNLTISASGPGSNGIQNAAATLTAQGVRIISSGVGMQAMGTATSKIYDSVIEGTTYKITLDGQSSYLNNTQLQGGPIYLYSGGVIKCHNVYDENFDPLACQ